MTERRSRGPLMRRLRGRALVAGAWLAARLPERPLLALADLAGDVWYRVAPARRRQARRNLARITAWMAERGIGSAEARRAAADPAALTRLVRRAFRHAARYYVYLVRIGRISADDLEQRFVPETPELLVEGMADPRGALFVGLHLGWYELGGVYLMRQTGRRGVVPTEVLADPDLQAFLVAARERTGVDLVEVSTARRQLAAALRRGDPVGLMGDRDVTGGGIETTLFGHPARLPPGPALLALETGAVPRVFGTWLAEDGRHHARGRVVPLPDGPSRRDRVRAYLEGQARAFEEYVAEAPDQWLSVFQPIWDDLSEGAPARRRRRPRAAEATPDALAPEAVA